MCTKCFVIFKQTSFNIFKKVTNKLLNKKPVRINKTGKKI